MLPIMGTKLITGEIAKTRKNTVLSESESIFYTYGFNPFLDHNRCPKCS
jgi:hypothetical protein